jgi:chromate transporter
METLSVVWAFFKIGIVSFGGGWSIVGLIKNEVVPRWMDEGSFAGLIAIAQSTPGPIALNAATLVGWQQGGIWGAVAATFSVLAFPVLSISTVGILARRLAARGAGPDGAALDEALRGCTFSMMLMTLWTLRPESADPLVLALGAAAFAITAFTKLNPLWAILGAGAIRAAAGLAGF